MNSLLESIPNLLGYSIPTILVICGLVLFFLQFFREMKQDQIRSARRYGAVIGIIGIVLALIIKPVESQPQLMPVYILPTPVSIALPAEGPLPIVTSVSTPIITPASQVTAMAANNVTESNIVKAVPSPTIPVFIPATNTPQPNTSMIHVWASEENGVQVKVSTLGVYQVTYLGDAYSPWPNEQSEGYRGWTTIVRIYLNRQVEWGQTDYGLVGPINQNDYLGPGGYYLDKNQAIASSKGDSRTFRLNAGDYIVFVTLDEKSRYSDNQGKVDIGITYLGQ